MQAGCRALRILVAFGEDYRLYGDALALALWELRPHMEVWGTGLGELAAEVERLAPDLVICSRSKNATDARPVYAWLKLPTGRERSGELWLDGEQSEVKETGLNELLRIVDEIERLLKAKDTPKRC